MPQIMSKTFFITTPIYYVNDVPHIGHSYTTIAADVLARYKRQKGVDVRFITGSDEHGQKIAQAAEAQGIEPQLFCDRVVERFKAAWKVLEVTNDDFVRTTEERHIKTVQAFFQKLKDQGDIYKGEYVGLYCTPCETFWPESQLKEENGKKVCPDCGRLVEKLKEETYFLKLSKYEAKLLEHIEKNPGFVRPDSRRHEVVNFIKQGLRDLSVTRTTFNWGVPVLDDPKHVVYVWFDALINYVTGSKSTDGKIDYWPADVHLMGKEIVRFHAVIWPIMLMAYGLPLPKQVFGHGWWTVEGEKMSKSKGNVVDPLAVSEEFGVEAFRYFILREVPFGVDGDYSKAHLISRFNSDLANDLGNLHYRTLTMAEKYFGGLVPNPKADGAEFVTDFDDLSRDILQVTKELPEKVEKLMDEIAFSQVLEEIWTLISKANTYIEKEAPWALAKNKKTAELSAVIFNLIAALAAIAAQLSPFMPNTAEKLLLSLGLAANQTGSEIAGKKLAKGEPLFPRREK